MNTVNEQLPSILLPGAPATAIRTILVADDETHILNVVSLKLRNAGFRVLTAREVPVGEFLVVKTADGLFESPAVVKAVQVGEDRIPRLILEFTSTDRKRCWIFPEQAIGPEFYYEQLVQQAKETSMFLSIIVGELESGQQLDQVFLSELKSSVDELREVIFRIQKAYHDKDIE